MFKKSNQKANTIECGCNDQMIGLLIRRATVLCKKILTEKEASNIVSALVSYRLVLQQIISSPVRLFDHLLSGQVSKKIIFPCDMILLRNILASGKIDHNFKNVPVFSFQFSEQHLVGYPIHIILDSTKLAGKVYDLVGVHIYDVPLNINDAILRINVNAHGNKYIDIVRSIVHEEMPGIETGISDGIPESKNNFIASSPFNLKKVGAKKEDMRLSGHEREIFDFLRSVVPAINPQIELRVVGGWVRDKLLGLESDDIDIAVSHIPGFELAQALERYANAANIPNVGKAYDVSLDKSAEPRDIENQTSDLMVGGINIFGQKIEFVPMRTEAYDEASRRPTIARTDDVQQDVKRRDLTINSLYYNIVTGEIEDYVGGMDDLNNMVLKTPDKPIKTFLEDPLRVLRTLRFHSRFPNSTIDESTIDAMKSPTVQEAYTQKVSIERSGKELVKMMEGDNAVSATRVLFYTGFYKPIFRIPSEWYDIDMDQKSPYHNLSLVEHTLSAMSNADQISKDQNLNAFDRSSLLLALLLHDFGKMDPEIRQKKEYDGEEDPEHYTYHGHEERSSGFMSSVLKQMGLGKERTELLTELISGHMVPHSLINDVVENEVLKELRLRGINKDEMTDKDWWRIKFDMTKEVLQDESKILGLIEEISPRKFGRFIRRHSTHFKLLLDIATADSMGHGKEAPEASRSLAYRDKMKQMIYEYNEQVGQGSVTPALDGNSIIGLVNELNPEVMKSPFADMGEGKVHIIKFVQEGLISDQQNLQLDPQDMSKAIEIAKNLIYSFIEVWGGQYNNLSQVTASNWYKNI